MLRHIECLLRLKEDTFDPSQTSLECSAYFSTTGSMLVVTIRCARLKLWSISEPAGQRTHGVFLGKAAIPCKVRVIDCSNFSSSSVKVRLRCDERVARDMMADRTIDGVVDRIDWRSISVLVLIRSEMSSVYFKLAWRQGCYSDSPVSKSVDSSSRILEFRMI